MFIKRQAYNLLKQKLQENKVILLYGPRRVGKTTLLKELVKNLENEENIKFVSGEDLIIQKELSSQSIEKLRSFVGNASLLIVDEAHKIPGIGLNLKLIVDHLPKIKVIASGSASFALAQKVGEPLTGRKKTVFLYPVSVKELVGIKDLTYYQQIFEAHLIFGGYPELFNLRSNEEKNKYLGELIDSYLFRDIFELEQIKNSKKIRDLLALLAFQIGKEVSLSELAKSLELHNDTVARYLDLMEKSFIIINIRGFSRNLRKEIAKTSRYYFYDNGVRNALINNFNPLDLRNDIDALWENYLVMERLKKQAYQPIYANNYFWRTYDQKEIDWVEERDGKLFGYEMKWGDKKKKEPKLWKETYDNAEFKIINQENYLDFVM
ncbi:MAG: ATP-binding protein [Candidatus Pacebacteria bacterium]|nr:ATP-binding protein [Candidatus Paceibacterota bacterium]